MPSADQHRNKAASNREFLDTISHDDFPDWVVVAAFYTAVHLVDALRAEAGDGHSQNHGDREDYVQNKHRGIHSPYIILKNASMLARYDSRTHFFAQFPAGAVDEKLLPRLVEIEKDAGGS